MLTSFLVALTVAAPLPPRDAQPPSGPGPSFVQVSEVNGSKEMLICVTAVQVTQYVPVTKVIEMKGMKTAVTEYVAVFKTELRSTYFDLKGCTMQTADGKALTAKEVLGRVKPGAVILVQSGAAKVDPAYLKILNPDTILLVDKFPGKVALPGIENIPPPVPKP